MSGPTLGETLRGARLGWHWSEELGGMLQLLPAGDDQVIVDLRPAPTVPGRHPPGTYICWWDEPAGARIVEETVLRIVAGRVRPRSVRRIVRFVLGHDGRPRAALP